MGAPHSGATAKKKWSSNEFLEALGDIAMGLSHRKARAKYKALSDKDIRYARRYLKMSPEEFHGAALKAVEATMLKLLSLLYEKADLISPNCLAVSYGILQDKAALLRGSPTEIHENRSLVINGQEKRYAEMEALLIDAQFDPEGDERPSGDAADRG